MPPRFTPSRGWALRSNQIAHMESLIPHFGQSASDSWNIPISWWWLHWCGNCVLPGRRNQIARCRQLGNWWQQKGNTWADQHGKALDSFLQLRPAVRDTQNNLNPPTLLAPAFFSAQLSAAPRHHLRPHTCRRNTTAHQLCALQRRTPQGVCAQRKQPSVVWVMTRASCSLSCVLQFLGPMSASWTGFSVQLSPEWGHCRPIFYFGNQWCSSIFMLDNHDIFPTYPPKTGGVWGCKQQTAESLILDVNIICKPQKVL